MDSFITVDSTDFIVALSELKLLFPQRDVGELILYTAGNHLFLKREINSYCSKTVSIPCNGSLSGKVFTYWLFVVGIVKSLRGGELKISTYLSKGLLSFNGYYVRSVIDCGKSSSQLELPFDVDNDLFNYIRKLDEINSELKPIKTEELSERFERDQKLVELIKKYRGSSCQICGFTFLKKNGELYSEIHHLDFLSKDGLDVSKNMLVLCANHHRQFHYGNVEIIEHSERLIALKIDDVLYECSL